MAQTDNMGAKFALMSIEQYGCASFFELDGCGPFIEISVFLGKFQFIY